MQFFSANFCTSLYDINLTSFVSYEKKKSNTPLPTFDLWHLEASASKA